MSLATLLRDVPVKRKLLYLVALSLAAATLFAVLAAMAEQWFIARNELAGDIVSHARILAANSTSSLTFDDRTEAQKTLEALGNIGEIEFAEIHDRRGMLFARYLRPGAPLPPEFHPVPDTELQSFNLTYVEVFQPIMLKGEPIGMVQIRSSLSPMYQKMAVSVVSLLAAMLGGLVVSAVLVARLHPVVTEPIADLLELMGRVSREKNYALRAASRSNDELGRLSAEFNDMLTQIELRDEELDRHRAHLEEEVDLRTAELRETNRLLEYELVDRKQAEEALRKANVDLGLFRTLMDNSTDGIEVLDPDTLRFLDVSEKECRDLGYSREELLAMSVFDIDPVVDENSTRKVKEQMRESGSLRFESVHRRKDGSTFPVEISVRIVELDRPYMLGMVRDITERKLAEEALRNSQLRYGELFEAIADAAYVHEFLPDGWPGKFIEANEQASRYTGYTREELLAMSPLQLDAPDSGVDLRPAMARLMGGEDVTFEQVHMGKDGRRIPVEIRAHTFALNGRPVVISIVRDITERKRAEELLRESEARYRGIFEYADDIIYLLEPDGTFRSLSPAFERITGWKAGEWIGRPFRLIVHPDDLQHANEIFRRTLGGESEPSFRLRIARKSGDYFDADLSITPLGRDTISGAMGIARDVTERTLMEEKIRKLNEELEIKVQERTRQLLEAQEELVRKEKLAVLGQVAGSVGHELRNPLGVMNNAVYFLQTVLADADASVKEYLEIIKGEIAGSERIVSDLLDSVRTKPPHPEVVGVAQLIEQTLGKCNIPSSVAVKLDIPAALPPLRVDSMQIYQVLRNLVSNGVEAMPEGGTLEIRALANRTEENITISVRDTGIGMTAEQLNKLFQPLFTTKARGIGLGLVVVKNLTEANGGSVEVQSEAGRGSTFLVTLPAGSMVAETVSGE